MSEKCPTLFNLKTGAPILPELVGFPCTILKGEYLSSNLKLLMNNIRNVLVSDEIIVHCQIGNHMSKQLSLTSQLLLPH